MNLAKTYEALRKDYHIQFYVLIAVSVAGLGLLVALILLLRKSKGSGKDTPQREEFGNSRKQKTEEPRFYHEPEEEVPSSRIKRYSREEFDAVADKPDFLQKEEPDEEDDFITESTLEEVEQELSFGGPTKRQSDVVSRVKDQTPAMPDQTDSSEEEDDFEFLDLDDES